MGPQGWLETYTFPSERTLGANADRALAVYERVVGRTLQSGTTSALYFGTLDLSPTTLLAATMQRLGQRGFIGKVCMDRNSPNDYCGDVSSNLQDTRSLIKYVSEMNESLTKEAEHIPLVGVALTPRFVPTCSLELMKGLADIASSHSGMHDTSEKDNSAAETERNHRYCKLIIQTHAAESQDEVEFCKILHPDIGKGRDLSILDSCGLLCSTTVLAHAVHMSQEEIKLCADRQVKVAHCPLSNAYFAGSVLPVQSLVTSGVTIGLATDVAGGYDPGMLSAMRACVFSSKLLESGVSCYNTNGITDNNEISTTAATPTKINASLDYKKALWLATVGGAKTLGLEDVTGQIKEGLMFDALIVSPGGGGGGGDMLSWHYSDDRAAPSTTSKVEEDPWRSLGSGGDKDNGSERLSSFAKSRVDVFPTDSQQDILQKFLHCGDDRDIQQVWVNGKKVVEKGCPCAARIQTQTQIFS
jgi:guanine deaminase